MMRHTRIFSIIVILGCHGQLFPLPSKPLEALLLYMLVATDNTSLNATPVLPQKPMFFDSPSNLQECLEQNRPLSIWYRHNIIGPPYYPNIIASTTAHVLGSQKLPVSQVGEKLQQVVQTTLFPDVEYSENLHAHLIWPLAKAVAECQITRKQYQKLKHNG